MCSSINERHEIISQNHKFSVSRDAIDTGYLYATSLHVSFKMAAITPSLNLSYLPQYFRRRLDFLLPENTMAPSLTCLALEIRIVSEILHQIKTIMLNVMFHPQKSTLKHEAVALPV